MSWMITYPSTCVLQFDYVTRKELVSIATLLSTPDYAQNLPRLRILPDPKSNSEAAIAKSPSLYHLELLDDTGAKRLSLAIAYQKGGLWSAATRTAVMETLAEFFSSVAGAKLVSNVRELWVHTTGRTYSTRDRWPWPVIPPIDTVGLVFARPPLSYTWTQIPELLGEVTEAGICRCPNLATLYIYACGAEHVDRARAVAAARKDAGRPLERLAMECRTEQPELQSQALELGGLVHELSVTVPEKKRGWWAACTIPEGWSTDGSCPWPERRE